MISSFCTTPALLSLSNGDGTVLPNVSIQVNNQVDFYEGRRAIKKEKANYHFGPSCKF